MKSHTLLGLIICSTLLSSFDCNSAISIQNMMGEFFHQNDTSGRFILSNKTEEELLVSLIDPYPRIGTTWNLTIDVDTNSSSSVLIKFNYSKMSKHPEWWEGPQEFVVNPSEVRSVVYISHFTSDFSFSPDVYIRLVNPSSNVSGFYHLNLINPGYPYDVGTSHLYVSNITAWLQNPPDEGEKTPIALYLVFYGGILITIILMIVFIFRLKH